MSGICAAGTGAFLDSVATKLNVPVEEMADRVNYDNSLEFSSVCAVLSATSINKFKNRFPLGDIIGGACRAQARTIMSGVGEIFNDYQGDIVFQGGVAYNRASNRLAMPTLPGAVADAQYYTLRPEKISLSREGEGVEGTLLERLYLGAQTEYTVRVGETSISVVTASPGPDDMRAGLRVGDAVRLAWDVASVRLLNN